MNEPNRGGFVCDDGSRWTKPHTLDDCRAAVEADWRAKFAARVGRIELLDSPPPVGLSTAQEIRARALDAAVKSLDGLSGMSPLTTTNRLATTTVDLAAQFADWIEHGDGAP